MIPPSSRFFAALATWALIFLAGPGILGKDGAGLLALVALVPWAAVCSRTGKRAFLVEWTAAGIGSAAMCVWSAYVWSGTLAFLALVPGLYMACAGAVLRLLARRFPLALAAPAAWVSLETLRCLVEPPFSYGWMRLGTSFHAIEWLAGSARVWGTPGLSFVAAAAAGGLADFLRRRRRAGRRARGQNLGAYLGAIPLALAIALSLVTKPPPSVPGPRLLLVQPSFEQHRKMKPRRWQELALESIALTARGVADAGSPAPDLVAWGETMFPYPLADPGLAAAYARGVRSPEWARDQIDEAWIRDMGTVESEWIRGRILGAQGVLPPGTSFLTGVEHHVVHDGAIRRQNAVVLFGAGRVARRPGREGPPRAGRGEPVRPRAPGVRALDGRVGRGLRPRPAALRRHASARSAHARGEALPLRDHGVLRQLLRRPLHGAAARGGPRLPPRVQQRGLVRDELRVRPDGRLLAAAGDRDRPVRSSGRRTPGSRWPSTPPGGRSPASSRSRRPGGPRGRATGWCRGPWR
jgi:hypothetical protein